MPPRTCPWLYPFIPIPRTYHITHQFPPNDETRTWHQIKTYGLWMYCGTNHSPTSVPTLACSIATSIICSMTRRSGVRTHATSDSSSKSFSASFMLLRLWDMYNFSIWTVWNNNKTHYNVIFALSSKSPRQNLPNKTPTWCNTVQVLFLQSLYMFRASSAHHREYLKLAQRPLVRVFSKIYNILTLTC